MRESAASGEDFDIQQIHIENPDIEFEPLAEMTVEPHQANQSAKSSELRIALTEGGSDLTVPSDKRLQIYGGSGPANRSATVIRDRATALGYYLFALEQHADKVASKAECFEALAEVVSLEPYHEFQQSLTERDRRLLLLDMWDERIADGDFAAEIYKDEATWRSTNLSSGAERMAKRIVSDVPPQGRMCYYSAGEAAIHESENDRVDYVEGIAMPTQACQAIRHAWLEIDGEVAEVTWPWHRFDAGEAVYIGQTVEKQRVKETRESRDINGAVLLSDDEVLEIGAAMRGERDST